MARTTGPRAEYVALWDDLRAQEEQALASLARARTRAVTAHDLDVQEVAQALRLGEHSPDVGRNEEVAHEETVRFGLAVEGAKLALSTVEDEIRASVRGELGVGGEAERPGKPFEALGVEPTQPGQRPSGEEMWTRYEDAFQRLIGARSAAERRVEAIRLYDATVETVGKQKGEYERANGWRTEGFVPTLTEEEHDALRKGSPRAGAGVGL
jgi:hypothetical protein